MVSRSHVRSNHLTLLLLGLPVSCILLFVFVDELRVGWLISNWVQGLAAPMHLGLKLMGPLCPISIHGSPVTLPQFQMAPRLIFLLSSGSKKKEPRYSCLSEAKASHSRRIWAEVSSSEPCLLHNQLSHSPVK
jgi:hypothetical protein